MQTQPEPDGSGRRGRDGPPYIIATGFSDDDELRPHKNARARREKKSRGPTGDVVGKDGGLTVVRAARRRLGDQILLFLKGVRLEWARVIQPEAFQVVTGSLAIVSVVAVMAGGLELAGAFWRLALPL